MIETLNRPLLVLIALIQGLLLFWLKEVLVGEIWPHDVRVMEMLFWSVFLSVPILLLLSLNRENIARVVPGALVFGLVVALVSSYFGFQLEPNENVIASGLIWVFAVTLSVLLFKVVMYLQIWASRESFTYERLFLYSWRNCILLALCALFVSVFGAILFLWAALFDVVGINFFEKIFSESWFLFPALALANGLAFVIFRNLVGILDTMSRVLRALCQFLLPVLVFISVLFIICLPFVGFSALWDTGRGTALVLWLQALTLFFFNATFQGEKQGSPYWKYLQHFVSLGLLVLPIYSLIAIYGLWLRVDQYGLTVTRCWAMVIVVLLALFAIAYSANLICFRAKAANKFGWINVRMGLVVLVLMVLVNTPVLDFRKHTVNSQLAALERGDVSLEDFDVRYFARDLGRPGYLALEALKAEHGEQFSERVRNAYRGYQFDLEPLSDEELRAKIRLYPSELVVPELLLNKIVEIQSEPYNSMAYILNPDLNGDEQGEWVVVITTEWGGASASLWQLGESGWESSKMTMNSGSVENIEQLFREGDVRVEPSEWQTLKIGELSIRVTE